MNNEGMWLISVASRCSVHFNMQQENLILLQPAAQPHQSSGTELGSIGTGEPCWRAPLDHGMHQHWGAVSASSTGPWDASALGSCAGELRRTMGCIGTGELCR